MSLANTQALVPSDAAVPARGARTRARALAGSRENRGAPKSGGLPASLSGEGLSKAPLALLLVLSLLDRPCSIAPQQVKAGSLHISSPPHS